MTRDLLTTILASFIANEIYQKSDKATIQNFFLKQCMYVNDYLKRCNYTITSMLITSRLKRAICKDRSNPSHGVTLFGHTGYQ